MRVAIYCRVSTQEQARNGLSLADQEKYARDWCKANHHHVVDSYIDGGISGRKPAKKRPELMRLLSDVEEGYIDLVVFTKLDRWFRNVGQYYYVQDILDKYHVSWKALLEDYETVTAAGRLKVNILLAVSEEEADRTSERLKFTFSQKKARGEAANGKTGLGYSVVDKKYVTNEQSPIAAAVFQHFVDTRNIAETARWLFDAYGIRYTYQGMRRLLGIETYKQLGIVSEKEWNAAQAIFAENATASKSSTRRTYLFSGLVYCAECGYHMSTNYAKQFLYYRCTQHYANHACPNPVHINEELIERYLLENVLIEVGAHNMRLRQQNKKPTVTAEAIQKKKDKLADLYLNDRITKEKYDAEYQKLQLIEFPQIQKEIAIPQMRDALDAYFLLSVENKKAFWSRIIKRIIVDQNKNIKFDLR